MRPNLPPSPDRDHVRELSRHPLPNSTLDFSAIQEPIVYPTNGGAAGSTFLYGTGFELPQGIASFLGNWLVWRF
jgi:hypothetical protein